MECRRTYEDERVHLHAPATATSEISETSEQGAGADEGADVKESGVLTSPLVETDSEGNVRAVPFTESF